MFVRNKRWTFAQLSEVQTTRRLQSANQCYALKMDCLALGLSLGLAVITEGVETFRIICYQISSWQRNFYVGHRPI